MKQSVINDILKRIEEFEQHTYGDLQYLIDSKLTPIIEPLQNLQVQVDHLTGEVTQLGEQFKTTLHTVLQHRLQDFSHQLIQPAQQDINNLNNDISTLNNQIQTFVDTITQPLADAENLATGLETQSNELKEHITSNIEQYREIFTETATDISDTMLEKLEDQLAHLTHFIEKWIADITGLGDEKIQHALMQHTEELSDEITNTIRTLLDSLLAQFDQYLHDAKQTLMNAVQEGSTTREAIAPALEQLESVKQLIEVVIEQVKSLGETIGISL